MVAKYTVNEKAIKELHNFIESHSIILSSKGLAIFWIHPPGNDVLCKVYKLNIRSCLKTRQNELLRSSSYFVIEKME